MRGALRAVPLVLMVVLLLPVRAVANSFSLSLPAESSVKIGSPSRLAFRVTNASESEGLSRLTLRFPSGYRLTGTSAPPRWTAEQGASGSPHESGEITFRTSDESKCMGALAPGHSLVFSVELIAPASRSVTPDSLVSAQGEQSCRGVALDPPATLPSWNRLGLEVAVAAGPTPVGLGGEVTVTMTVSNASTVALTDIGALLRPTGTGGVSRLEGPTPAGLTLAPGASGSMTWRARAASPGALGFSGQAMSKDVTSPPVRSDTLVVGDLDVSLSVTPEQVVSGQEVRVEMTVRNRGSVRVANVVPSPVTFEGTATTSAPGGPSPASWPDLEPGESATFTWAVTITGRPGETYAFSGWAAAERDSIVSVNTTSNRGVLASQELPTEGEKTEGSLLAGGGGSTAGGTAVSGASSGVSAAAVASAGLQFVGVGHDGRETGGAEFSAGVLRDLRILVGWSNLSGTHTQRLELFGPDGFLYQRFTTQFAATSVETRLLVGGTWITEHSLFGPWRVEVFLDRETMPTASSVFVLTP